MASPDAPLTGSCPCGTIRFEVTAPFETAGYCHCKRCQRRTGTMWSLSAMVDASEFRITEGADALRLWPPPDSPSPKAFCTRCGGHVHSGDPSRGQGVWVRLGQLDGDPGIRPQWHQWVESAPDWYPLPDDGLPRFARGRNEG
jgi:hypothetical protein